MTTPKPQHAVPACVPPLGGSAASQRHRHRSLHSGLATALLLSGGLLFADGAAAALTLDSASWNSGDKVLKVSGGGATSRVTLVNAYNPSQTLGTDSPENDGRWSIKKSRPSPVPCRVRVTQSNGQTAERDVSNAPATCSPKAPSTNIAPTAKVNGPYNGTIGTAISFSSAGSSDPDGSIASYAWTFGDGTTGTGASPTHAYTAAGTYTVTLKVTDNASAASAIVSTTATVVANNVAPTANANGPYSGTIGTAINFSSAGSSDPDGTITSYAWAFGDGTNGTGASPTHAYTSAGTFTVSLIVTDNQGTSSPAASTTATIPDPVACNSPIAEHCTITAYTGPGVCVTCHEDQARDMHSSVHYQQGGAFPNTTNIPKNFAAAGERPAKAAGDLVATGINTYCGTHENSPRFTCAGCHVGNGRFPLAQSKFDLLTTNEQRVELANIDCLMCHQEVYKRFPDWTKATGLGFSDFKLLNLAVDSTGHLIPSPGNSVLRTGYQGIPNVDAVTQDFQFMPAGIDALPKEVPMTPMAITTLEAAQTAHSTTRQSCLNCHAGAAGADGAKRGDLSKENINPSVKIDVHMSPAGVDLTCSDCHNAILDDGTTHRVRGRGLDLRANDVILSPGVADRFTCDSGGCHTSTPHGDYSATTGSSRDKHAMKVACQTCHIPAYAKAAVGTEIARDWQDPHPADAACNGRGGWLPREDKGGLGTASLVPSYTWFDGTSEVAYLDQLLTTVKTFPLEASIAQKFVGGFAAGYPAYALGMPNGTVSSGGTVSTVNTKIYPMKKHWGKLARNDDTNTLVGHSTFEFFRTGSFCRAVAVGLGLDEANTDNSTVCAGTPGALEMPLGTTAVPVFTYQTINHGVEPAPNALGSTATGCGTCHKALTPGTPRMDMTSLGYGLRTDPSVVVGIVGRPLNGSLTSVCSQCHENKTEKRDFKAVHALHVSDKGRDCAACHNFSRPERSLSLTKK